MQAASAVEIEDQDSSKVMERCETSPTGRVKAHSPLLPAMVHQYVMAEE
jgi:hypothetical protein